MIGEERECRFNLDNLFDSDSIHVFANSSGDDGIRRHIGYCAPQHAHSVEKIGEKSHGRGVSASKKARHYFGDTASISSRRCISLATARPIPGNEFVLGVVRFAV